MSLARSDCDVCKDGTRARARGVETDGVFTVPIPTLSLVSDGDTIWAVGTCPAGHGWSRRLREDQVLELHSAGAVFTEEILSCEARTWLRGVSA